MSSVLVQLLLPAVIAGVVAAATASVATTRSLRAERKSFEKEIAARFEQWRQEIASRIAEIPAPRARSVPAVASARAASSRPLSAAPSARIKFAELSPEPLNGAFLYAGDPESSLRRQFIPVGAKLRIGRSSDCDIVFQEATTMSQVHAEIEMVKDQVWVADLNSRNGTFLNGRRIRARTPVPDLATLSFGGLETRLVRI